MSSILRNAIEACGCPWAYCPRTRSTPSDGLILAGRSPGRDVRDRREPLLGSPRMSPFPQVLQFLVVAGAGWINQQPRDVIDSLQEENRVLREQLGPGRLRFTDAQRRRRAAKAKRLGRRVRSDRHTLVTPDTLLRWVLTPLSGC